MEECRSVESLGIIHVIRLCSCGAPQILLSWFNTPSLPNLHDMEPPHTQVAPGEILDTNVPK